MFRGSTTAAFRASRNASMGAFLPQISGRLLSTNQATKLSWDEYFTLRKQRRRLNLVSSFISSVLFTISGGGYLATLEFSATQTIMGIDAPAMMGIATVGIGALGWLSGPLVGNMIWRRKVNRLGWSSQVLEKEKELYHHITKNRVDPRMQSVSNPVPDYYGEKIGSLKDYRRWLKDQRAYNKKREMFL